MSCNDTTATDARDPAPAREPPRQADAAGDAWPGLLFLVLGAGFAFGSLSYAQGSAQAPGPGYFPLRIGIILALIGAASVLRALWRLGWRLPAPPAGWAWRPLAAIVLAMLAFGELLPRLGLLVAMPVMLLLASLALERPRWCDAASVAAIVTLLSWLVFVAGLGLLIPVLPSGGA